MRCKNKKIVFLLAFLMISSWVLFLAEAGEDKNKDEHKDKHKDGGSGAQLESEKFIQKINSSKAAPDQAAKQICGKAPDSNICEQTVMVMNNKSEPINPITVLTFQLTALKEDLGLAHMDAEAGKSKDKSLEFCAGSYKKADDEIASAMKKSQGTDLTDVPTLIMGAMKHVQSCQVQIESDANAKTSLIHVNHFLKKMADNAVAIVTNINTAAAPSAP